MIEPPCTASDGFLTTRTAGKTKCFIWMVVTVHTGVFTTRLKWELRKYRSTWPILIFFQIIYSTPTEWCLSDENVFCYSLGLWQAFFWFVILLTREKLQCREDVLWKGHWKPFNPKKRVNQVYFLLTKKSRVILKILWNIALFEWLDLLPMFYNKKPNMYIFS